MTIITRYLVREFLKMVGLCLLLTLTLFVVIEFVDEAEKFLKYRAGAGEILRYYLFRLPALFSLVAPVAVLLGVLITVSLRARANELTAIFSSGVGLMRVCAPILAGCVALALVSLGNQELLAPAANRKTREIERLRLRPGSVAAQFSMNRYWIRGEQGILSARIVDPASRVLQGFQYLELERDFRLRRRIDARSAAFRDGKWLLRDGKERLIEGDLRPVPFAEKTVDLPVTIQGFLDGETPPEDMTHAQLSDYVRESRERGYDVGRYEVDLHAKWSYPLLNVIVSLIAIPFALRTPRSGGVWRSIGAGLVIGFVCWMTLSASLSMGRKGLLPPALAAWLPDVLLSAAGLALFRRARR